MNKKIKYEVKPVSKLVYEPPQIKSSFTSLAGFILGAVVKKSDLPLEFRVVQESSDSALVVANQDVSNYVLSPEKKPSWSFDCASSTEESRFGLKLNSSSYRWLIFDRKAEMKK